MMKRLTCTLAALALVMSAYIPAQAEFKGTLKRDQPWMLEINNASYDNATATVYYLGRDLEVAELVTVPSGGTVQTNITKPGRGVRRVIVEVDEAVNGEGTMRIVQGANAFSSNFTISREGDTCRWVFDVE